MASRTRRTRAGGVRRAKPELGLPGDKESQDREDAVVRHAVDVHGLVSVACPDCTGELASACATCGGEGFMLEGDIRHRCGPNCPLPEQPPTELDRIRVEMTELRARLDAPGTAGDVGQLVELFVTFNGLRARVEKLEGGPGAKAAMTVLC